MLDPKMLLFCSCGLLRLNVEAEFDPVPVFSVGGGPAGVVDVPKIPVLGLLLGVEVSA